MPIVSFIFAGRTTEKGVLDVRSHLTFDAGVLAGAETPGGRAMKVQWYCMHGVTAQTAFPCSKISGSGRPEKKRIKEQTTC